MMCASTISYRHFDPATLSGQAMQGILTSAIGPRPIAFASTLDADGKPNLSPFSFFNAFGANPPILVFSPARRGRDNTTKHTYENLKRVPEVVINVVNYAMVHQVSLASSDYDAGVNEFEKAGFTMEASSCVKPWRVKESPVQFECKVLQIIETGLQAGAGNLVICEVVQVHIHADVLDDSGKIDPNKIDLVGRLGGEYYCRASGDAIFEVEKPLAKPGIGVDNLPKHAQLSPILTGNDLGKLGNLKQPPTETELKDAKMLPEIQQLFRATTSKEQLLESLHALARQSIAKGKVYEALTYLMLID
jgi:flavin reductase (DIM6/NTAB) family NADH-FMN oxidoreductase RutF